MLKADQLLAIFALTTTAVGSNFPGCTPQQRSAARTVADIVDESCKDSKTPKECLESLAKHPKISSDTAPTTSASASPTTSASAASSK